MNIDIVKYVQKYLILCFFPFLLSRLDKTDSIIKLKMLRRFGLTVSEMFNISQYFS